MAEVPPTVPQMIDTNAKGEGVSARDLATQIVQKQNELVMAQQKLSQD